MPAGKRDTVLGVLDDEGIDYVVTDETSGREFVGVVYFPIPTARNSPLAVARSARARRCTWLSRGSATTSRFSNSTRSD